MRRPINSRNLFLGIASVLLLAAVAFSLSFGTLPPADYTFVNATEVKTLDPAIATGVPEHRVISAIFEGLTAQDPKDLSPIPGVAERWDISDDKRTYTFHLRNNALWTDGTPVTAGDFVYSWRRFLHPATAAEYSYEMWYLVGAEKFTKQQLEIGDAVEIELPVDAENGQGGPYAYSPGKIIKGKLLAIESSTADGDESMPTESMAGEAQSGSSEVAANANDDEAGDESNQVYIVEIDGAPRRFRKGGQHGKEFVWILPDFDTIGVKALDDHTLRVELKHPVPYFLDLMAFYPSFPVNRKCVESHDRQEWTKPENIVTNGPFRLAQRRLRDRMRLVKNELYWDSENVRLNVVDALAVESITTALNLYLTEQAHWIEYVPAPIVPELLAQNRPDFQPEPFICTYFYRLNTTRPPLDNVLVRRALNLALNKRDIVERVTLAGQQPARSLVPPVVETRTPYRVARCPDHHPDEARRLLAEAGYPGGRGFPEFQLQYNNHDLHRAVAELVQHQWKEVLGIDVELRNLEWGAYLTNQNTLQYDLSRSAWVGDYPDPNTYLNLFTSDGGNNKTGWSNTEYDRLIDKAHHEPDEQKRAEYFHQAEELLMSELPILPLFYYVSTSMSKPYVRGYFSNFHDLHPLKPIWIDQEAKARYLREVAR